MSNSNSKYIAIILIPMILVLGYFLLFSNNQNEDIDSKSVIIEEENIISVKKDPVVDVNQKEPVPEPVPERVPERVLDYVCIINCPPDEVPLAIQTRCNLGGALSANDITKGEPETAIAFLSINDEAGAIELAKALDEYPWYKLGSSTHGHDIKGDNIPISQGGSEIIPSSLRARYGLTRNVYMPGSNHDALIGMIEGNADNLEALCRG